MDQFLGSRPAGRAGPGALSGWRSLVVTMPYMRWARSTGVFKLGPVRPRRSWTARKLAERVYRLLKYGAEYVCQEMEAYEAAYRARLVKGLARKAAELGYRLEPE